MSTRPRTIIVGCGRLGSAIGARVARQGGSVTIIDRDADALSGLPVPLAASSLVGDPMQSVVLQQATAQEGDLLIATTREDNVNVAIAVVAREVFGIGSAIVRVREPARVADYEHLRVHSACTTTSEADVVIHRVEREAGSDPLRVIVVGCGRLGSYLARALHERGHHVTAVDRLASSLEGLEARGTVRFGVRGDATDPAVLWRAGAGEADRLITLTHDDSANLMVGLMAMKLFGVGRVVARIDDPRREPVLQDLGLQPVSTTTIGVDTVIAIVEQTLRGARNHGQKTIP